MKKSLFLSRDYDLYPLKRGEKIPYDDLIYLYIKENMKRYEISSLLGVGEDKIKNDLNYYNIKKDKNKIYENIKDTHMKHFNGKWGLQTADVKNKSLKTINDTYGNIKDFHLLQQSLREKIKEERYGDKNFCNKNKIKITKKERYGDENYNNINKISTIMKEKYGSKSFLSSEKYKQLLNDNEWKQKLIIKQQNSKLKNNSFHVSLQEEEIYKLLVEKYGYVKRQYKSKEYPFYCDFFIPSENLYIEYNGHWTHNKEPFINSKKQQNILNEWKNKKSKFYNNAIVTWTKRDVLKRETAEKNNLNWKEFFNMEQIKLFLNT